jgi:tetratricopeptide (TPR) repeat protein
MQCTTTSDAASASFQLAVESFVQWRVDAMSHLEQALEADPDFPMAHAFQGLFQYGGRNDAALPDVVAARDRALAGADAVNDAERGYIRALDALVRGQVLVAVLALETIVAADPTDLLAHRLLQQELFWGGEAAWMADVVDRSAAAWSVDTPGYSAFQSLRAFSLEEAGRLEEAERAGRGAVEMDPGDCWGAHAVAHVLTMRGDVDEGERWLRGLCGNWAGKNQIVHHLWWHLCVFLLERGDHAQILHLLDTEVRNPDSPLVRSVPDAYIDLQNIASMYLRLELRGVDVGGRWEQVAEYAAQRIGNFASPFTSAHAAMILAACGRFQEVDALIEQMQQRAREGDVLGARFAAAAVPAARAALAHRRGDYEAALAQLMPARRGLWQMGGSHAQRDVFTQLLLDAARRTGRADYVAMLLQEAATQGFHRVQERSLYRQGLAAA